MKLNTEQILQEANAIYAVEKLTKAGYKKDHMSYLAPEMIPTIQSDQVKAMMQALINAINKQNETK